jgi:type VI secretion system VasD/TssJ family lipoprotein
MRGWKPAGAVAAVALVALLSGGCCSLPLIGGGCTMHDHVRLRATLTLNDCEGYGSQAVTLRVYSLADTDAFADGSFDALWMRPEATLGDALVAMQEKTLRPGEETTLSLARDKKTRAIGIVVNFCEGVPGCWKQTLDLGEDEAEIAFKLAGTCLSRE